MNVPTVVTVVVDNQSGVNLVAEHGLAMWVTVAGLHVLWDTGAGSALLANAAQLGIDLQQADALVLSHGHHDHSGGLGDFLACNTHAPVYYAAGATVPRFSCHAGVDPRAIGMSAQHRAGLQALPSNRVQVLNAPQYLAAGVGITGPIPRRCAFEDAGGPFYFDAKHLQPDPIADDQALWLETPQGLCIVLGCCHAGLINTVDYIREVSGIERVSSIVGGLHLRCATAQRLQLTIDALASWQLDGLVPCHCAGDAAVAQLRQCLGNQVVRPGRAGMVLENLPSGWTALG